MTYRFTDILTLDGVRKRKDGYLVADARVARTGIQVYAGSEVGRPDLATVRVYRSPEEVFSVDSMASFANIPVTNDHPPEQVTADNWKQYAKGHTSGDVARDGETLRIPLMVGDKATIDDIEAGKRELSNGYLSELDWTGGTTPDGERYDAAQKTIRGNHVAVVMAGRAGSLCRIGDGVTDGGKDRATWGSSPLTHADMKGKHMTLRTILVDGLSVETTDQGAQAIEKLQGMIADMETKAVASAKERDDEKEETDKAIAKKDAEIEDLKSKILTPEQISDQVKALASLTADAKAIAPDLTIDGLDAEAIRKAVVADALPDLDLTDRSVGYIDGRFESLRDKVKADKPDAFRDASKAAKRKTVTTDMQARDAAYGDYVAHLNGAHLPTEKGA